MNFLVIPVRLHKTVSLRRTQKLRVSHRQIDQALTEKGARFDVYLPRVDEEAESNPLAFSQVGSSYISQSCAGARSTIGRGQQMTTVL